MGGETDNIDLATFSSALVHHSGVCTEFRGE